jgi:hypothetical protein
MMAASSGSMAEVQSIAVAPWTAVGPAPLGQLLLLAADPSRDGVGLLGMDGGEDAGAEQVIGVADVELTLGRGITVGYHAVELLMRPAACRASPVAQVRRAAT